jgi:hypothetical protein
MQARSTAPSPRRRRRPPPLALAPAPLLLLLLVLLLLAADHAAALAPGGEAGTHRAAGGSHTPPPRSEGEEEAAAAAADGAPAPPPPPPSLDPALLLLRADDPPVPGRVTVARYPPRAAGFSRALSDADVAPLVRDNLDPDMAPFRAAAGRQRRRSGGGGGGGSASGSSKSAASAAAAPLAPPARWAAALRRALTGGETTAPAAAARPPPPPSSSSSSTASAPLTSPWTGGPGLSVAGFEAFVARFDASVPRHPLGEGNAALVVLRNGSVSAHWLRGRDNHFRFACLKAAVESARALRFPDTAFLLNIDDFPVCRVDGGAWPTEEGGGGAGGGGGGAAAGGGGGGGGGGGNGTAPAAALVQPPRPPLCPFPVLTNYKRWDAAGGGSYETNEVLLPVLNHHYEDAYFFPWAQKRPKALMRASQQGCMPANSSRVALAVAAERAQQARRARRAAGPDDERRRPGGARAARASPATPPPPPPGVGDEGDDDVLDAGIVRIDGGDKHLLKRRFSKAGFVPIEEHAKWKFLVSADGCVAQTRLAKVLLANSVVLKEASPWIEHYYRSLRAWTHYAPFAHRPRSAAGEPGAADGEVRAAVARLLADDAAAARVAAAGQRFAYRHLGQFSRLLYLRRLLVEYNALFGPSSSSSSDGKSEAGGGAGGDAMAAWVRGGGPERAVARARAAAAGGGGRGRTSGGLDGLDGLVG